MSRRAWVPIAAMMLLAAPAAAQETSCVTCHGDADLFDEDYLEIVERFRQDVHAAAGLGCHDCHGGNPSAEVADDPALAKDEGFEPNPYRGAPARGDVPGFCGRCHSDPAYMRRFNPAPRVDQEREYWTSRHGQALAAGNARVATCTDCHSHHGILGIGDPASPVYPTRVGETCRSCHSDPERMAGVTMPDGRGLPTNQYALWRQSVHAAAMFEKGDFSAPTCNDCHGNHGATPPGVDAITNVCGQCHGREARLFRSSPKHAGYEEHNEYMEGAGEEGCAACHAEGEPQAELTAVRSFTECATCHGNHAVIRPTLAMLGPLPETPCAFCHEGSGPLAAEVPEPEAKARHYETTKASLLATAGDLAEAELFDWLVDQAQALPFHTLPGPEDEPAALRPEFRELFEKFRIGKTAYVFADPDGEGTHRVEVVRCNHCHGTEAATADAPLGYQAAEEILGRMRELTASVARAERILLAARRGGVETRGALAEIEKAVDAQIGLEVLLHTFDAGEESDFVTRQQEGLESARAGLQASREAMDELGFRRRGLVIFLVFVVLVAVGLAFKIRELSARDAARG
jgi:hypothetical protein